MVSTSSSASGEVDEESLLKWQNIPLSPTECGTWVCIFNEGLLHT